MYSLNVAVRSVVCIDRKTKTFSEARSSRRRLLLLLLLLLLLSPYPFWLKLPNTSHRRGSLVDIRPDDGHEIWLNGHETCAAVPPATSRAASQRSFYKHLQHSAFLRVQPYYVSHGSYSKEGSSSASAATCTKEGSSKASAATGATPHLVGRSSAACVTRRLCSRVALRDLSGSATQPRTHGAPAYD